MSGVKSSKLPLTAVAAFGIVASLAAFDHPTPGNGPGINGARYATDAYPGFDSEDDMIKPERKEPRWFQFITGPDCENAKDQLKHCVELIRAEDYAKARKQLDALVRNWPTAPEAPKAQQALADLCFTRLKDYEDAFAEYRYLLDFYSLQCDYGKIADRLYQVAGVLKIEGKEVMFVRFANTVDVRRAYETCILRAPGAKWVPEAMLIIAGLREDEGKNTEAVQVYENLRNLHDGSEEAKTALAREAGVRMAILREHAYNRARSRDTIDFLELARRNCRAEDAEAIQGYLAEAKEKLENEAYEGAKFYDSSTRTKRSAIRAYERFLADYPTSAHADEVRARIEELKGESK